MPRPRSYSFDHFKVPKSLPPERASTPADIKGSTHRKKKKELPTSELGRLHYGKEHAETELIVQEHRRKGGHDPRAEQRVVRSLASGKPGVRGGKKIARAEAAARRKVARTATRSATRARPKKR